MTIVAFPKPNPKDREERERQERQDRALRVAQMRTDCLVRAGFRCENPDCRKPLTDYAGCIWDHWLGGSGRRRAMESVETTWVLCFGCNEARTANRPSAAIWNDRFRRHAELHGYKPHEHYSPLDIFRSGSHMKREGT